MEHGQCFVFHGIFFSARHVASTGGVSSSFSNVPYLHDVYAQDLDVFLGLLLVRPGAFDLVDDVEALCRAAKDGMLAV
jgi:hypothetical protein